MTDKAAVIRELVAGNRILANQGLVDAFGHISVRNPENPNHYFLSRSRSPELVEVDDIMEFDLENNPIKDDGRPIYAERPIHGAIFAARPDVMSVVHNHCPEILPFAITNVPMRPALHSSRRLGEKLDIWDIAKKFGDTDLLVSTNEQGQDLAKALGSSKAIIMRGHGCAVTGNHIPDAVHAAIAVRNNAQAVMSGLKLGPIQYLTPGEITPARNGLASLRGHDRAWEYLCNLAGVSL